MRDIFDNAYVIFRQIFFTNVHIVGTHLNCLDFSRQFK